MLAKFIRVAIIFLVFVLILDPGDLIFHLKVPLFVLIFLFWLLLKTIYPIRVNRAIININFLLLSIPLIGICVAILQQNLANISFAFGFIKSFIIILLSILIIDQRIDLSNYLVKLCFIIPAIIIPIYILFTVNPTLFIYFYKYLAEKDVAKFSQREFYGYKVIMLYYRTSPLLLFPLAYYFNQFLTKDKKPFYFILSGIFLFTLILSGTRANMLAGVVVVSYLLFNYLYNKRNKFPFLLGCLLCGITLLSFLKTLSFSETDKSSDMKAGHYDSYIKLFMEHPQYLVWGEGLGSQFYSSGNADFVTQTELTYIDLIRWFGIPLAIVLILLLLYPIIYFYSNKKVSQNNRYLIVSYWGYLFIAGTNPLLVSSTGMLAVLTLFSALGVCDIENDREIYRLS
jgi:hypothetical protein